MRPVGEVFRLKARYKEIRGELTPSLGKVIDSWMGHPVPTEFRSPDYVYESTCLTEPLKMFIKGIVESLSIGQPTGGPLERAFGFGKTHAMILLWHLLNSDLAMRHKELAELGLTEELVRGTLVLGIDFTEEKPFAKLVEELKAYADPERPAAKAKDHGLVAAVASVLGERRIGVELSSRDMARLIIDILLRYRERGGRPRLLLTIDELGYGASLKLKVYCEERREELYAEVTKLMDFLSHLYAELERAVAPSVVVWAIADQDSQAIKALRDRHYEDEALRRRIEAVLGDLSHLSERYRRGTGGASIAAFSYSPKHAIQIARFRVLKAVEGIDAEAASKELLAGLKALADQLNITGEFEAKRRLLEDYYPFSPGLVALMMKLMRSDDMPGTEFVRSLIAVAAKAAEKALTEDPTGSFTIGLKHLELPDVAWIELLRDIAPVWAGFLPDMEHSIEEAPEDLKEVAQHISKLIAAKGITAVLPALMETKEKDTIAKYGVNLDEIQLDILASYRGSEALKAIEKIADVLEYLKAESGRIDEREVEGAKYYLPSVIRTPFAKLAAFITEERGKVKDLSQAPFYMAQGVLPSLFSQLKIMMEQKYAVSVLVKKLSEVVGDISLDKDVMEAQRDGQLAVIIVRPWDLDLFGEIHKRGVSYDRLTERITSELSSLTRASKLPRPLHIVIMLPDASESKIRPLLEDRIAVYEATRRFVNYLSEYERVVEDSLSRVAEELLGAVKRIPDYEKIAKLVQRRTREIVDRQLADAKDIAQKRIISLSRELVADVVKLYEKAIYYSVDEGAFVAKDIAGTHRRAEEQIKGREYVELNQYAPIVNKFVEDIIKTMGFSTDVSGMASKLRESCRSEFEERGIREYERMEDVIENLLAGVYGVRPLNRTVAHDAVRLLNGTTIDLKDRVVEIIVDEERKLVVFKVKVKERGPPPPLPPPKPPVGGPDIVLPVPQPVVDYVPLSLPANVNAQDLLSKLSEVVQSFGGEVSSVVMEIKGGEGVKLSATAELKDATPKDSQAIGSLINVFNFLANAYAARLSVALRFKRKVEIERLRAILGEYFPKRLATFDGWLS